MIVCEMFVQCSALAWRAS